MRKLSILTALLLFTGIAFSQNKSDIEKNKKVSVIYHELKAENIDDILTEDFTGRNEKGRHTWKREDHRSYLSNGNFKKDTILNQVAEGNWVATRFERTMDWNGERVSGEIMQFKRFENGKIAEIWEYADPGQIETGEE